MIILTLPVHIKPNSQEWGQQSNTRVFRSQFTSAIQTLQSPGALWMCRYSYPSMNKDNARLFKAFLAKLRGQTNRFKAIDFTFTGVVASVTATASVGANVAVLSGPVSAVAGNYVTIGGEFKMIVEDSSGTSITIEPPFRDAHAAAAADFENPSCLMVINEDSVKWLDGLCDRTILEFSATEAI